MAVRFTVDPWSYAPPPETEPLPLAMVPKYRFSLAKTAVTLRSAVMATVVLAEVEFAIPAPVQ